MILQYSPAYKQHFKDLNIEWISQYFVVEPHDLEQLDDPEGYIIAKGGRIYFAQHNQEIVGTVALIKVDDITYEFAKMAVKPSTQGLGIGLQLGQYLIEEAKKMGCKVLFLESNTILTPALSLYRKLGFQETEIQASPYSRANYKAEIRF